MLTDVYIGCSSMLRQLRQLYLCARWQKKALFLAGHKISNCTRHVRLSTSMIFSLFKILTAIGTCGYVFRELDTCHAMWYWYSNNRKEHKPYVYSLSHRMHAYPNPT